MTYEIKNFDEILGTPGFSEQLLKNHFKLYEGYVNNTNKLSQILKDMLKNGKTDTPEFAELKRRFGWEFNGMRLHELYFGNISKKKKEMPTKSVLFKKMVEEFGSGENCEKDFVSTGTMRGIGWVIMYYDKEADRLFNTWINEHDVGHLSSCIPILIMDVFEHAYMIDYGLKKADYIKAFVDAIDWDVVQERFEETQK